MSGRLRVRSAESASPAGAAFGPSSLDLDLDAAAAEIEDAIREIVGRRLRKRGAVVGVSGGIDSSVCAAIAARALGPERTFALLMPERGSSGRSTALGRILCERFDIPFEVEDITPALDALGCYRRSNDAVRSVLPAFRDGDRFKITVAAGLLSSDRLNYFTVVAETAQGRESRRLPHDAFLALVAAMNMKQRTRKLVEYSHAERLNYAVIGTPNRLEYDQGFFVRGGDGLADLKPIAHLYKTQVYALARHIGVPDEVCAQSPTTDTYTLPQSQEEFYFALPYQQMDLLLYAFIHRVPAEEAAAALYLTTEQVKRAFRDILAKRRVSQTLHQQAILVRDYDWSEAEP